MIRLRKKVFSRDLPTSTEAGPPEAEKYKVEVLTMERDNSHPARQIIRGVRFIGIVLSLSLAASSCYVFRKKSTGGNNKQGITNPVLGESIGARAGGLNEAALQQVYDVQSPHPPAGVRPDPDMFMRQILLQYREQGSVVAREIGRVEAFRMLLGGANENFTIVPQESYDATSLLAEFKVAEQLCRSLVAPDPSQHPGWTSILPAPLSDGDSNIRFLAQRLLGVPSESIDEAAIVSLKNIHGAAQSSVPQASDYVPVCTALIMDAEALLL